MATLYASGLDNRPNAFGTPSVPTAFGWQSKRYEFALNRDLDADVQAAVQAGDPTRLLAMASYYVGPGDRVRIIARLGGASEIVLLDHSYDDATPAVDNLEEELTVTGANIPAGPTPWYVSFRVEILTARLDPTPESPDWPFVNSEPVTLYLYKNRQTQSNEIRMEPIESGVTRSNVPVPGTSATYRSLPRVQTVFYFKGMNPRLRAGTAVSDATGRVAVSLPPGQYDVECYGEGFLESEWLTGDRALSVGAGDYLTAWKGSNTTGVQQSAEFGYIKTQFSSLYWPGYMIAEDFAPSRAAFRDEAAENNAANYVTPAFQWFGRVFAGNSYVDFVGIAIDPPPE